MSAVSERIWDGDIWFSSDSHYGHENIIKYCDRPFKDADHMDEVMIERWNDRVAEDDVVFHLGDVAMGDITRSLPKIARLNGKIIMISGNHDRTFSKMTKTRQAQWLPEYEKYFYTVLGDFGTVLQVKDQLVRVSHFPYDGDHTDDDRYRSVRPVDDGMLLIHGHTHSHERLSESVKGTVQYHVGVDAHDFYPVHYSDIEDDIVDYETRKEVTDV